MARKKIKDMSTEELLERERALRKKDTVEFEERMNDVRGWLNDSQKEVREFKQGSKGYTININQQSFTINNLAHARDKVKALMDIGLWWITLSEKT